MIRDRLFLLQPGFENPAYPGQTFYCWHCALIEGVLVSFPQLGQNLDVVRIAWPRPRRDIISLLGEDHQSVPVLVLGDGDPPQHPTNMHEGRFFISDKDEILAALTQRHGFPLPHP